MKILYVSTSTDMGGAETSLRSLALFAKKAGHSVKIISLKPLGSVGKDIISQGIEVVSLNLKKKADMLENAGVFARLIEEIENYRPDIVHAILFRAIQFCRSVKKKTPFFLITTPHYDLSKKGLYRLYSYLVIRGSESQHCSNYVEFEVTSVKSYKVTMKDEDWLFEDLKDRYYEGEKITVKIGTVTDTGYLLLANGKNVKEVIPNSDGNYDYWEFEFTMPNEDVVLEFKTYDGFLQYPNESRLIESYILTHPDVESAWVDRYYGEYESGAIVAIIQSQNDADQVITIENIQDLSFIYPTDNTIISVLYGSSFYSVTDAYNSGYLSNDDLVDIYQKHVSFFDYLYKNISIN